MKHFFLTCILVAFFCGCQIESYEEDTLYIYTPKDSEIVVKINDHNEFFSVQNNKLLKKLKLYKNFDSLQSIIAPLKKINPNGPGVLSFDSAYTFVYATKYHSDLFIKDSLLNRTMDSIQFGTNANKEIVPYDSILFSRVKDSVLLVSNSKIMLSDISASKVNIKDAFKASENSKVFAVYFRDANGNNALFKEPKEHLKLGEGLLLDFETNTNTIYGTGIYNLNDSTESYLNVFKDIIPQENTTFKVCPKTIDELTSITFNDYRRFRKNLFDFKQVQTLDTSATYFDNSSEIACLKRNANQAVILKSLDAELTEEAFDTSISLEGYKDVKLYKLIQPINFSEWFGTFLPNATMTNYCRIDEFFIFSENLDFLKSIISDVTNENTLEESQAFQSLKSKLSDESSLLTIGSQDILNTKLNSLLEEKQALDLSENHLFAIQYIYDTNFAHVNLVIEEFKSKRRSSKVEELHNITLDQDLLSAPQLVTNHRTKEMEIVVQDVNNKLYLISNSGNALWKKQLDGPILGKIEQIDTYKNGRLQLAFATKNRVYVIDRNGNDVNKFPLNFKDDITQPLSVFDYDKRKDYRLLVTQGFALLMYDKNGKAVSGFNYQNSSGNILTQPKHIRVGSKDYLVFAQNNKMQILNRVGKTRIDVKDNVSFSNNAIYFHKNKFSTTTANGNLFQSDLRGRTSRTNLNLNEGHTMVASSKTMVTLDDNILKIKTNTVELPFGNYSKPQLFYLNHKIYVSVTDLQSKKVYLFDSLGKSIPNFPVFGSSAIALENIDKDHNLEFVVQGDSNSVLIYEID